MGERRMWCSDERTRQSIGSLLREGGLLPQRAATLEVFMRATAGLAQELEESGGPSNPNPNPNLNPNPNPNPNPNQVPAVVAAWGGCLVNSGVTGGDWEVRVRVGLG